MNTVMKRLLFTIVATACLLSACATPLIEESAFQNDDLGNVIIAIEQTEKPSTKPPVELEQSQETQTPKPTAIPTVIPTVEPEEKVKEEPTPIQTVKPTAEPTEAPKQKPTVKPTVEPTPTPQPIAQPTPETQDEIIPVSSSFINAAMAEINRLREANGVAPAAFSGGISSSCKSHAIAMAESGEVYHASGIYMFEAVGRASKHMPGATMGGAAANHVVQLQSDEVTKIGIGAVYYGDYVFYVVSGN